MVGRQDLAALEQRMRSGGKQHSRQSFRKQGSDPGCSKAGEERKEASLPGDRAEKWGRGYLQGGRLITLGSLQARPKSVVITE